MQTLRDVGAMAAPAPGRAPRDSTSRPKGFFSITRPRWLDRLFSVDDLGALIEMLRHWYVHAAGEGSPDGAMTLGAVTYAFPRPEQPALRDSLSQQIPDATFDASDPDELRIIGSPRSATADSDVSLWREVLCEPRLAHTCVMLRLTFDGPAAGGSTGMTTFVLCGAPSADGLM